MGDGVWLGITAATGVGERVGLRMAGGVELDEGIEVEVAKGLRVAVSVGAAKGLGATVRVRLRLGFGVDVRSSRASCSELVNTLIPPIKSSTQTPNETNRSANCQGFRSKGMGSTGSPTEKGRSVS